MSDNFLFTFETVALYQIVFRLDSIRLDYIIL